MRRYRHVIFDFDGVLCDSLGVATQVFNQIRDLEFPDVPRVRCPDDMVEVYGGSLRTCLAAWLDQSSHRRFFDLHSEAMAERAEEVAPFPGVEAMLAELPPGSASIATSAYSDTVLQILGGREGRLPASIYEVVGREHRQTKTEKLRGLTKRLGLDPEECFYVGDLESDVIYCRALPMDILTVTYGYHPRWHLETLGVTWLAHSVEELRRVVRRSLSPLPTLT